MSRAVTGIVLASLVLILLIGLGAWYFLAHSSPQSAEKQVATSTPPTAEATSTLGGSIYTAAQEEANPLRNTPDVNPLKNVTNPFAAPAGSTGYKNPFNQ